MESCLGMAMWRRAGLRYGRLLLGQYRLGRVWSRQVMVVHGYAGSGLVGVRWGTVEFSVVWCRCGVVPSSIVRVPPGDVMAAFRYVPWGLCIVTWGLVGVRRGQVV